MGKGTLLEPAAHGSRFGISPTLKGSNVRPLQGRDLIWGSRFRRFHLRLLTEFPSRGTWERSNLFESHWLNQWLTSGTVTPEWQDHSQDPYGREWLGSPNLRVEAKRQSLGLQR